MNREATNPSILTAPWLHIARGLWLVLFLTSTFLFVLGVYNQVQLPPATGCMEAGASCPATILTQEDVLVAEKMGLTGSLLINLGYGALAAAKLSLPIVGWIIFWRKSNDWVALLLALALVLGLLEGIYSLGQLQPVAKGLYLLDAAIFFILPFVFPNGRFVPGWTRWTILPMVIMALPVIQDPGSVSILTVGVVGWLAFLVFAMVYRYRYVSTPLERQQTKWVIAGFIGTFMGALPWVLLNLLYPSALPSANRLLFLLLVYLPISGLGYFFFAGSIAFAILRYRLWDIDLFIRRTLQYSVITATLGLVYLGGIAVLQQAFTALTGQTSPLAVVLSTLLSVILFNPLRRQVQTIIDRRFYRQKYDAVRAMENFSAGVRREVELDNLTNLMVDVTEKTVSPEKVWVWLKR